MLLLKLSSLIMFICFSFTLRAKVVIPFDVSYLPMEITTVPFLKERSVWLGDNKNNDIKLSIPFGGRHIPIDETPYYSLEGSNAFLERNRETARLKKIGAPAIYSIMPYLANMRYDDAYEAKDEGLVRGIHLSRYRNGHTFSLDLSLTDLALKNYSQVDTQFEYVFTYSLSMFDLISIMVGIHNITSDSNYFNIGGTYIFEFKVFKYKKIDIGSYYFYSSYVQKVSDELTDDNTFQVSQISPYIGVNFEEALINGDSLYFKIIADLIDANARESSNETSSGYTSYEISVAYSVRGATIYLSRWFGEQRYAVKKGGFVVYNSEYVSSGGYGGYLSYAFSNGFFGKIGYDISTYGPHDDKGTSVASVGSISIGVSF